MELVGKYYKNLVKEFYENLKAEGNCILSRVKGVAIHINEVVWRNVGGFQLGGMKSHLGIFGVNKMDIYHDCVRNPNMTRDHSSFRVDYLRKDERVCASAITWILLPRGEDHTQLTTEDVYLLQALRAKIQTNWTSVIRNHMIKVTRQ